MQTCILIVGMHRSGTSALMGALYHNGLYLGEQLLESNDDNQKGFYENKKILQLNNKILVQSNSSWDDVTFSCETIDKNKWVMFKEEIKTLVKNEFFKQTSFGIKDPRICILLPLWLEALSELNIEIKIVWVYRNPYEVAASLQSRNNFSFEKSLNLFLLYIGTIFSILDEASMEVVFYEDILENPLATLERLMQKLHVRTMEHKNIEADFIDDNLYRQRSVAYQKEIAIIDAVIVAMQNEKRWYGIMKKLCEEYLSQRSFYYNDELIAQVRSNIDMQKRILNLKKRIQGKCG